ncbi:hypothetical protein OH76DRAFT_1505441 [Lentinus brumalis]|uniref:F-box domain-containing protein n=1 Tax=Lentinus brumalis TaxID=2498619 RepID=A0A371CK40_9APHY|nr:hypothetical protein OH76DRAFT_1505441 [Polyporus brumalis]
MLAIYMSEPQELLVRVNHDVLVEIIELLLSTGGLNELSQISRRVRVACMPILFRQCFRPLQVPLPHPRTVLPPSLWLHVQSLVIRDDCPDKFVSQSLQYTNNRLLCGALSGPLLDQGLSGMPRLRSVTIYQRGEEPHGMSWPALRTVMSHAAIREFTLDRLHFCPALCPRDDLHVGLLAPLESFRYLFRNPERRSFVPDSQRYKPNFGDETAALDAVLGALHETLKGLCLLSEAVPVRAISQHPFPCLRSLVLRGEPSDALLSSLLSTISHIQSLRSLVLKFSRVEHTRRIVLWQGNAVAAFPWPALEEFVITYPDPADQIFSHLPCFWRHFYHEFLDSLPLTDDLRYGRRFALLLTSSALRQLLHRAHTPLLVRLTLEYHADHGDEELLYHISRSYPQLSYLKLIRYRPRGMNEVPVVSHRILDTDGIYAH